MYLLQTNTKCFFVLFISLLVTIFLPSQAQQGPGPKSRMGIQGLLKEEAVWQASQQRFAHRLAEEYPLYPDVVGPLRAAILQIQHGMRLVASQVRPGCHTLYW